MSCTHPDSHRYTVGTKRVERAAPPWAATFLGVSSTFEEIDVFWCRQCGSIGNWKPADNPADGDWQPPDMLQHPVSDLAKAHAVATAADLSTTGSVDADHVPVWRPRGLKTCASEDSSDDSSNESNRDR